MNIGLIRTPKQHEAALARIEVLMDAQPGTAEADELELLSLLVARYEDARFALGAPDPIEYLRNAMMFRGLAQKDLAELLGSRSRASEVLNRQRPLNLAMIRIISAAWRIPAEPLMQEYSLLMHR
jgi:HTH-type transcriptional regulator / antitoxin HigA